MDNTYKAYYQALVYELQDMYSLSEDEAKKVLEKAKFKEDFDTVGSFEIDEVAERMYRRSKF